MGDPLEIRMVRSTLTDARAGLARAVPTLPPLTGKGDLASITVVVLVIGLYLQVQQLADSKANQQLRYYMVTPWPDCSNSFEYLSNLFTKIRTWACGSLESATGVVRWGSVALDDSLVNR